VSPQTEYTRCIPSRSVEKKDGGSLVREGIKVSGLVSKRDRLKKVGEAAFENSSLFLGTFRFPTPNFCNVLPYFSKSRWITHLQISHEARLNAYLLNDTKNEKYISCIRL
jgi:hypothetical protein